MPTLHFKVIGAEGLLVNFDRLKSATPQFRHLVLQTLAERLLSLIIQYAPADTGEYVRQWRILRSTPDEVVVGLNKGIHSGSGLSYDVLGFMLEFSGTKPHIIRPRGENSAVSFMVGGKQITVAYTRHTGMRLYPHIRPALQQLRREAPNITKPLMDEFIASQGKVRGVRLGSVRNIPPRQIGRSTKDVSANIGRGTKGKIGAQLTSRFSGRKRIRRRGLVRYAFGGESTKIGRVTRGSFGGGEARAR